MGNLTHPSFAPRAADLFPFVSLPLGRNRDRVARVYPSLCSTRAPRSDKPD
jgi:hypothetical protein